ncbi:MAG: HAMP domain-containing histidine kinase, partial [Gemmatimonadetes bacterium]|nr:HAMP domain-containing histidine kinase [Gemmatimonadota bacterium]
LYGPVASEQQAVLGRVQRAQRHLLGLINDVLNYAKLESGRVEYDVQAVPLADIVADVGSMIEPQLAMKRISYEVQVPPDLLVRGDPEKIEQILLNLLGNAAKFTEPGGRIRVDAVASPHAPGKLLVRVQDTGIGIPTAKVGAIFDPFVQVDASATRSSEGSGLGLAISRDLARGMGGDITATSTLAKGSTFTLTLPVRQQRTSGVPDPSLSGGSAPRL